MSRPWFVEAVQAVDGLAFIGERSSSDGTPTQVYFVSAPEFRPVPVRNLATALWGAHGTFQERIYAPVLGGAIEGERAAESGAEPAFESLAQAIEFVRRLYVVLGLPPTQGTTEGSPPLAPMPGGGPRSALLSRVTEQFEVLDGGTRPLLRDALVALVEDEAQREALKDVALGSLLALSRRNPWTVDSEADFLRFGALLQRTGLWLIAPGLAGDWHRYATSKNRLVAPESLGAASSLSAASLQHGVLNGFLFRIPAPSSPSLPAGMPPTLGGYLCWALADRRFLAAMDGPALAVVQLGALLLAACTVDLPSASELQAQAVARESSAWLARSLPDRALAGVQFAEELIAAVASRVDPEKVLDLSWFTPVPELEVVDDKKPVVLARARHTGRIVSAVAEEEKAADPVHRDEHVHPEASATPQRPAEAPILDVEFLTLK